jgi:N-acetylneuraminate synthase
MMKIDGRSIGPNFPPYIIAEISGEHKGIAKRGYDLIDAAKKAGANAVKLQCYTADSITFDGIGDEFRINDGPWKGRTLHDLYKEAETTDQMISRLAAYAKEAKITALSSVFTLRDVDFIKNLGMKAIKTASFELNDLPLIRKAASTGLPMIISTGMGTREEIIDAINSYNEISKKPEQLAVLHCVSSYPSLPKDANLPDLGPLSELCGGRHVVGISDHSLGVGVAAAAVAFGACIVEKHITLLRSDGGPDAGFSLEPHEFRTLVTSCLEAWEATRPSHPQVSPNRAFRKSLYAVQHISCGDSFSDTNVRSIRPAKGLSPKLLPSVMAGVALQDIPAGTPLRYDLVSTLVSSGSADAP